MTEFPTQRKDGKVAHIKYEVNGMVNNASDKIDVNNSVSTNEGSFHKNNGVHVGSSSVNEYVTKVLVLVKGLTRI